MIVTWLIGAAIMLIGCGFVFFDGLDDRRRAVRGVVTQQYGYSHYDRRTYRKEETRQKDIREADKKVFWGGVGMLTSPLWFVAAPLAVCYAVYRAGRELMAKDIVEAEEEE